MIVNPQFFNYRIIIGSLIVGMAVLAIVSINSYGSSQAQRHFLDQEKKLVESELSQMISRYDHLSVKTKIQYEELENARKSAKSALEKLWLMKSDASVLTRIKFELSDFQSKNIVLSKTFDSIHAQNERLEHEKLLAYANLNKQQTVNASLVEINKSLKNTIEKGGLITANSFTAKAYKSGIHPTSTDQAAHASRIEICFTLAENILAEKGMKDIYIQILNPLNNVIGNKGSVEFGKFLLFYSHKQRINYSNKVIDVCTTVTAQENDKPFKKGIYYVSVFNDERKLGSTQIELN